MPEDEERLEALEKRVDYLEKQVAALFKRGAKPAPAANRSVDYRERYDSLDYPER